MELAALLLRALDNRDAAYRPYALDGDFTEDEQQAIATAFKPHVPERVDAGFNNWQVTKINPGYFLAKRATWHMIWSTETAADMAEKIRDYYER